MVDSPDVEGVGSLGELLNDLADLSGLGDTGEVRGHTSLPGQTNRLALHQTAGGGDGEVAASLSVGVCGEADSSNKVRRSVHFEWRLVKGKEE